MCFVYYAFYKPGLNTYVEHVQEHLFPKRVGLCPWTELPKGTGSNLLSSSKGLQCLTSAAKFNVSLL